MKKIIGFILSALLITACTSSQKEGPSVSHGLRSAAVGLTHFILSPVQIAAGLLEGIASVPYYISTNIHDINQGLVKAQAEITLDDTYEAAYGERLSQVPGDGDRGEVFRRMKHATEYFQKVLHQYGVQEAEYYILASIDTARDDGYILFSVVYRPSKAIRVEDKYDGKTIRNFRHTDRLFYEPFRTTADGQSLDVIIDWAGLPKSSIATQKTQATLITLAANAVVKGKQVNDYWKIEKQWIAGAYEKIVEKSDKNIRKNMKI